MEHGDSLNTPPQNSDRPPTALPDDIASGSQMFVCESDHDIQANANTQGGLDEEIDPGSLADENSSVALPEQPNEDAAQDIEDEPVLFQMEEIQVANKFVELIKNAARQAEDFTKEELATIFWSRSSWNNHHTKAKSTTDLNAERGAWGRSRASKGVNVNMLYIVDENGSPVDGHRASSMQNVARSIWAELASKGLTPKKWKTDTELAVADHYRREMQNRFPELKLCENCWKADQIAIDYYPSWHKAQVKKKKGKFNIPIKHEKSDNAMDSGNEDSDMEDSAGSALDDAGPSTKRRPNPTDEKTAKKRKTATSEVHPVANKTGTASASTASQGGLGSKPAQVFPHILHFH